MHLSNKQCEACRSDSIPLTIEQATTLLKEIPNWALDDSNSEMKINCRFKFKNFVSALDFVTHISELAEAENHHPDISFGWGYATVCFYTHKIKGLHENDFIMAAKVNDHYQDSGY